MNYTKIIKYDCANGEGWRTSLFVSGCTNHCPGCFNQEAQDFNYGKSFDQTAEYYLQQYLNKEFVDGLSILGGDPLSQSKVDIYTLARLCAYTHNINKNVWLWTGYKWEDIFPNVELTETVDTKLIYQQVLLTSCDVVIDGPFVEELKDPSLKWRGSSNQRIIDVKQSLQQNKIILWKEE